MSASPLVLHDFFLEPDGGGRVACLAADLLGAELVAGHVDFSAYPEDWFSGSMPRSLGAYDLRFPPVSRIGKLWRAFASMPVRTRPFTVFSGQISPLAHGRVAGPKILYCHTPPRLLYDKRQSLLNRVSPLARPGLAALLPLYARAYERAVADMDLLLCNSENVRRRIRRFLGRDAEVVHPPAGKGFSWIGQGDYYLSTARLAPLKRVETVVRAFLDMPDRQLVVAGSGPDAESLRELCRDADNIRFAGWVDDVRLRELVGQSIATIYIPEDEDFGMSPVESMAAGKPVIGVAEGGLLETVVHGETGLLLDSPPSASALRAAVRDLDPDRAASMRSACEARADLFSEDRFCRSMVLLTEKYRKETL